MATLVENTKARFNYEITDTLEAGVELLGLEVKSLKSKRGSLDGAYAIVRGGEAYLINVFIPPYQEANTPADYDAKRNRRLLLTKKEIAKMVAFEEGGRNLTVVPISVYTKGDRVKVEIAFAKGKKKFDKRETVKRREADIEARRAMKGR